MSTRFSHVLFLPVFLGLWTCTNIFQPAAGTYPDANGISDVATLIGYGDAYLAKFDYAHALVYYDRAISLSPTSSKARMNASRTVVLRDNADTLLALGTLSANSANPLGALVGSANTSTLFSSNGALNKVQTYLNSSSSKNWFNGQCDSDVPTNSLSGLFHLLYTSTIELPVIIYDMHRDFIYNNTNHLTNNGDLLVLSNGTIGINPTYDYFVTELNSIAVDAANPLNWNTNSLLLIDARLKVLHDLCEVLLLSLKTIDPLGRLDILDQIIARINTIPGSSVVSSTLTTLTSLTASIRTQIAGDASIDSFLRGHVFNAIHSNLNGSWAFVSNSGLSSFTNSPWVDLSSSSVQPSLLNAQGILKIHY